MKLFDLDDAFFRDFWRRRPVVRRGAGRALMAETPSPEDLAALREDLSVRCDTDGETVWFYQELGDALPMGERLVAAGRLLFESEFVTCDAVQTKGPASIGSHFDVDDNFSIQLVGAKRWRLSPPDTLPPDLVRRRLLREPDVGRAQLGDQVTELVVEAGDVLYIPQTWIHRGDSTGDSLSVTLVVHTRSFHLEVAASVVDALRHDPAWVRPVPVGPGSRAARDAELAGLLRSTFTVAAAERLGPHIAARGPVAPLGIDMARVRSFVAAAPAVPIAGFVLPADGSDTSSALRALLARRTMRRLLSVIVKRCASTRSAVDRILYQQCVDAMLACTDPQLDRLCTEPELVSIAAIAVDGEPRHEDPLAAELARALMPELVDSGCESVPFALLPDLDGAFTLRRAGVRVVTERPHDELLVRVVGGTWQVYIKGRFRPPEGSPGLAIELLPRLHEIGPTLSPSPTAWVARNVREQEVSAADPDDFVRFCEAMSSGAQTLEVAWPAAWREVSEGVRWLLPLSDRGAEPHNYSVHAFRGLVASSPRPDHRCAQTLAHEAAHNRFSTILDLFELCASPGRVTLSPIVDVCRPMSFVFHGCFAFAQDVVLTERLLEAAPAAERVSMAKYLDTTRRKASAAVDLLEREAELTPVGSVVLQEVAEALDR